MHNGGHGGGYKSNDQLACGRGLVAQADLVLIAFPYVTPMTEEVKQQPGYSYEDFVRRALVRCGFGGAVPRSMTGIPQLYWELNPTLTERSPLPTPGVLQREDPVRGA